MGGSANRNSDSERLNLVFSLRHLSQPSKVTRDTHDGRLPELTPGPKGNRNFDSPIVYLVIEIGCRHNIGFSKMDLQVQFLVSELLSYISLCIRSLIY